MKKIDINGLANYKEVREAYNRAEELVGNPIFDMGEADDLYDILWENIDSVELLKVEVGEERFDRVYLDLCYLCGDEVVFGKTDEEYSLRNVFLDGKTYDFYWKRDFMHGGEEITQYKSSDGSFVVPDVQIFYVTFEALYNNSDHPFEKSKLLVEEMRDFFSGVFDRMDIRTATFVQKNSNTDYDIIHSPTCSYRRKLNCKTLNFHSRRTEDELVAFNSLFGTRNQEFVKEIFKWLTGKGVLNYSFHGMGEAVSYPVGFILRPWLSRSPTAVTLENTRPDYALKSLGVRVERILKGEDLFSDLRGGE